MPTGVYERTSKIRENISKGKKGKKFTDIHKRNLSLAHKGQIISEETKIKMSIAKLGERNHKFTGTNLTYLHNKAWKLFGKDHCEVCGISNEEHNKLFNTRLHMHCTLNPKDYTIMTRDNWSTNCVICHASIERNQSEGSLVAG